MRLGPGRRGVLALLLLLPALATARADEPAAAAPIRVLNDALLAAMKAGKTESFAKRVNLLGPAVEGAFDLPGILRTSVGPRWSEFSADDQKALLTAFTAFTLASYAANFDGYDGQRFEVLPDQRAVGPDLVVATRIVPKDGDPARIDYVMRQVAGAWKAVDVLLDGSISRVALQRSDFRTTLANGGAPALIRILNKKTADLAGGTPA